MKNLLLYTVICIFLLIGCTSNSRRSYIKNVIGSELIIPSDLLIIGESSCSYLNYVRKPLKIIVYSDSTNCLACDIKLPTWKIKYKELSLINKNIGIVFIINTNNTDDIELIANVTKIPGFRLYDPQGMFKEMNHLHDHRDLHVFLLDQDNKVLLIGNPLDNYKLYDLYKQAIEVYTNQK